MYSIGLAPGEENNNSNSSRITRSVSNSSFPRGVKTRVTDIEDADTFSVESTNKQIRLGLVDAPETAHPEEGVAYFTQWFNTNKLNRSQQSFENNPLTYVNKFFAQPYAEEATEFTKRFINNQPVTISPLKTDTYGRLLSSIKNYEGKDLATELVRRGLAHVYPPGHPFHDKRLWTAEIEQAYTSALTEGKGLYKDREYIKPQAYKHGALALLDNSYQEDVNNLKEQINIEAYKKAQDLGVSNPQFSLLFNESEDSDYLLAPSKLGSSYYYSIALHNQLMRQAGYESMTTSGGIMGIGQTLYNIAIKDNPNLLAEDTPYIVQKFDRELYQPGLGMLLNEHIFIPQGLGRLYKDEVGLIPSIFGAVGAILDNSYTYYSGNAKTEEEEMGQTYSEGVGYKSFTKGKGLFEAVFEEAANFAVSTSSAVALYLAVGEPLNLITSEVFKAEAQEHLDWALSTKKPTSFTGRLTALGRFSATGYSNPHLYGDDLKLNLAKEIIDLEEQGKSYYSPENFKLTAYHLNALFFRERGAYLLETVMKPFVTDYINPFTPGTDKYNDFIDRFDKLTSTIQSPPSLKLTSTLTSSEFTRSIVSPAGDIQNTSFSVKSPKDLIDFLSQQESSLSNIDSLINTESTKLSFISSTDPTYQKVETNLVDLKTSRGLVEQALLEDKGLLKQLDINIGNVGVERQSEVAKNLQGLLDVIPLNIFHWRLIGGINDSTTYSRLGNVLSFEEATRYMQKLILNHSGINSLVDQSTVKIENPSKPGEFHTDWNSRRLTIKNVLDKGIGSLVSNITSSGQRVKELREVTERFRRVEREVGKKGVDKIGWDEVTGRTVNVKDNVGSILDALGNYQEYIEKVGGSNAQSIINNNQRIKDLRLSRITSNNVKALGSDILRSKSRSSLGLFLSGALFTTLAGNELFQSSSGVSIFTQIGYALKGEEAGKLSAKFEGNRLLPTEGIATFAVSTAAIVATTYLARKQALRMQKEGLVTYSIDEDILERDYLSKAEWSLEDIDTNKTGKAFDLFKTSPQGERTKITRLFKRNALSQAAIDSGATPKAMYVTNPIIQSLNDRLGISTFVLASLGLLATAGLRNSAAWLLNSSREGTGTLDPLVAGTIGIIAGGIATKSPTLGLMAGLGASAIATVANIFGAKLIKIGGDGIEASLGGQPAGQLSHFHALVKERASNNKASDLELMAGFYAHEFSKLNSIVKTDTGARQVQVVARQVPLPFVQFFLAEQIKGQRFSNGSLTRSDSFTRSYSIGMQANPILGTSFSVQLPIVYQPDKGVGGIAYNPETNLLDVLYGAGYLTATSSLIIGSTKIASDNGSKLFRKLKLDSVADSLTDVRQTVSGLNLVPRTLTRLSEFAASTSVRILTGLVGVDYNQAKSIMNSTINSSAETKLVQARTKNETVNAIRRNINPLIGRAAIGWIIGANVGSIYSQLQSDITNTPTSQTEHSLYSWGFGVSSALLYPTIAVTSKQLRATLIPPLGNITNPIVTKLNNSYIGKKALGIGRRYGGVGAVGIGIGLLMTSSDFGIAQGMDNNIEHRLGVVGLYGFIGATFATTIGKFGLSPAETLRQYEKILIARGNTNYKPNILTSFNSKAIEADATYIIESAQGQLRNIETKSLNLPQSELLEDIRTITNDYSLKTNVSNITPDRKRGITLDLLQGADGLIDKIGKARYLKGKVAAGIFGKRLTRSFIGLAAVEAIVFSQLSEGGDNQRFIESVITKADQGNWLTKIAADTFRLITGRDIAEQDTIYSKGIYSPKGGRKLLRPKGANFNATQRAFEDISQMFVFDESNPFISPIGLGGMTFRPGEYGTRTPTYFQLQSSAQDISTAVYSLSPSFLFKEAAAGSNSLQIQMDWAVKTLAGKKGDKITDADMELASARILNVTSMLPQLANRRKSSRPNQQALSLIGRDSLLANIYRDRERREAQLSYQPAASLYSELIREAIDPSKPDISSILTGLFSPIKNVYQQAVKRLSSDKFHNYTRESSIRKGSVRFFAYDYKTKNKKPEALLFDDESQFASTVGFSTTNANQQEQHSLLSIPGLQYLWNLGSPNTPFLFKAAILGGGSLTLSLALLSFVGRSSAKSEYKITQGLNDEYYSKNWYGVTEQDSLFRASKFTTPQGIDIRVETEVGGDLSSKPIAVIRNQESIFRISDYALGSDPAKAEANIHSIDRKLSTLSSNLDKVFKEGFGSSNLSFLEYTRGNDFISSIEQTVTNSTNVTELKTNLSSIYESQIQSIADRFYGTSSSLGELRNPSLSLIIDHKSVPLYKLLHPNYYEGMPEKEVIDWVMKSKERFINDAKESITKTLSSTISSSRSTNLPNQLTNTLISDSLNSHVRNLTEQVLTDLRTSSGFKLVREQMGVLEPLTDKQALNFLQASESWLSRFGQATTPFTNKLFKTQTTNQSINKITGATSNLDPNVTTPDLENRASSLIPDTTITGRTSFTKSISKVFNMLGIIQDIFTSVDIFSSFSRLGKEYSNSYATSETLSLAKREVGMVLTNTIIGLGIGAVTSMALTAVAGVALTSLAGFAIVAGAATAVGLGVAAFWKNGIAPTLETVSSSKFMQNVGKGVERGYNWLGDNIGEFVGGTIPSLVNNDRVKSAITTGIGGGIAGAAFGVGGLILGGIGTVLSLPFVTAMAVTGAGIGFLAGAISPEATGNFFTNLSRSIYQLPYVGSMFASNPVKQLLSQSRYQNRPNERSFYIGTAEDAIKEEASKQLEAANDFTGGETANSLIDDSLQGGGGTENSYKNYLLNSRNSNGITVTRPSSLISPFVKRELQIRSQYFNQQLVGNYNWRMAVKNSPNAKEITLAEANWRQRKSQVLMEAASKNIKQLANQTKVGILPTKVERDAVKNEPILNQIIEVRNYLNAVKKIEQTSYNINIPKRDIKATNIKNHNNNIARASGKVSVVQTKTKVVDNSTSDTKVLTASQEAADNNNIQQFSKPQQFKVNPSYQSRGITTSNLPV